MGVTLGYAKFQPFTPRGTVLNLGLNEGEEKNVRFFTGNTGHISKTVRDTAYVTINH